MNRGVPPTARKARTGEFTPPGITVWARANASTDRWSVIRSGPVEGHVESASRSSAQAADASLGCRPSSVSPLQGPVGQDHVGPRPSDARQRLADRRLAIDPTSL